MLVVQRTIDAADAGEVEHPADLLDEFHARFMVHGSRSPFAWASRLRVYGKKVRDSTTSMGHIAWADDGQSLSYRDIPEFRIPDLRRFVGDQIGKAQTQLEGLLLVHPEHEAREDLDVQFHTHRLTDNAAEGKTGWSFVRHPSNRVGTLPDRETWLYERILRNAWLRDEFQEELAGGLGYRWKEAAAQKYLKEVDAFLERLLLLVHITGGQPARGTELLSLRHLNSFHGYHRSVFIEHGMVSTVTSYHKGYSVTGSTKIIHRYLPQVVGELLVYYLWLVLPFRQQLELVALHRHRQQPSPFLWAKEPSGRGAGAGTAASGGGWDSSRLSRVLQREFEAGLGLRLTIPIYRHLAIAISRRHLPSGGFKRDYGLEDTKFDSQSAHASWTAGSIYARGLDEAQGHVQGRQAEYRKISREWHDFLGLTPSALPAPKRPVSRKSTCGRREHGSPSKRRRIDVHEAWHF